MNRLITIQKIRECLRGGGQSIGSWMQIPHPSIAEIMGQAGYDWVAVDMEHGSTSVHQLPDLFRALELGGTLPLVRLAHGQPKDCKQALDAGAGGVIVPMVESAEQLIQVRDACRWPPSGKALWPSSGWSTPFHLRWATSTRPELSHCPRRSLCLRNRRESG